jgi:aryl-alcohol dehydrogenase-like predicted oxidoreductase
LIESLWKAETHNVVSFVSLQPHYNLLHRDEFEEALEGICQRFGLGVIPYSPLAGGVLTGKYSRSGDDPDSQRASSQRLQHYLEQESTWTLLDALERVGKDHEKTISQMALAWLLQRESVTSPIIGPRSLAQLQDNLGSIGINVSPADMQALDDASRGPET